MTNVNISATKQKVKKMRDAMVANPAETKKITGLKRKSWCDPQLKGWTKEEKMAEKYEALAKKYRTRVRARAEKADKILRGNKEIMDGYLSKESLKKYF